MLAINRSGQRAEFNMHRSVDPDQLERRQGTFPKESQERYELNKYLDSIRVRISEDSLLACEDEEAINPLIIEAALFGNAEGPRYEVQCSTIVNNNTGENSDPWRHICDGT